MFTIESNEHFEKLLSTDQEFARKVRWVIRRVMLKARAAVGKDAKANLGSDPRDAYKAVRAMVYKRLFGGNINIITPRKAGNVRVGSMMVARKGRPGQQGGNRMARAERTNEVDGYYGRDRGFILRFNNDGTNLRMAGVRNRKMSPANRGVMRARRWFTYSSHAQIEDAAYDIQNLIDQEIQKMNL